MIRIPCEYRIPTRDADRPCGNRGRWFVRFLLPDDGKMRVRRTEARCTQHSDEEQFFPKGSSQITQIGTPPADWHQPVSA